VLSWPLTGRHESMQSRNFVRALVRAGVRGGMPATVLSDGDAGFWNFQRAVLLGATVLKGTLEGAFRRRYPDFRPAHRNIKVSAAV
jgi:hypothetical protein